mgnify:CR=1 FL=1
MQVEIVQRPAAHVLGIMARINPMNADYNELWGQRFTRYEQIVTALAVEPGYYGVYYATDEPEMADFVAGMMVRQVADVPDGLTLRAVPAGTYAAFACTMSTIGQTWADIYARWLPASEYVEDEGRPALEYYPPDMSPSPDGVLTILVPIKSK